MKLPTALFVAAAATLGLAACSDSPSPASPATPPAAATEVPVSATVSAAAYTDFAKTLASSETAQPLDVSKVTPPTSETAAPQAL